MEYQMNDSTLLRWNFWFLSNSHALLDMRRCYLKGIEVHCILNDVNFKWWSPTFVELCYIALIHEIFRFPWYARHYVTSHCIMAFYRTTNFGLNSKKLGVFPYKNSTWWHTCEIHTCELEHFFHMWNKLHVWFRVKSLNMWNFICDLMWNNLCEMTSHGKPDVVWNHLICETSHVKCEMIFTRLLWSDTE